VDTDQETKSMVVMYAKMNADASRSETGRIANLPKIQVLKIYEYN